MEKSLKLNILEGLKEIDDSLVIDSNEWPKAYFHDISNIKAVLLGCDPSNQHNRNLEYAFGIGTKTPLLKQFFTGIKNNLDEIEISLNEVYVQNLCQNYFKVETSKNPFWRLYAKIWIKYLKEELDSLAISKDTPVFLTAEDLYKALIKEGIKKQQPKELYSNLELVPIKAEDNYLNRPLIPLFRGGHGYYDLKKWPNYTDHLKKLFLKVI
jgi:hypothetical protein